MNCPNCGAENDPDARFCAECGTPLESDLEADEDRTIISRPGPIVEEAKTVAVTQEQIAAVAAQADQEAPSTSEPESEGPQVSPPEKGPAAGGLFTQRNIIIALVVLVLLCCCCAILGIGVAFSTGSLDLDRLSGLPVYLSLV